MDIFVALLGIMNEWAVDSDPYRAGLCLCVVFLVGV
jgi:hypothetical protein